MILEKEEENKNENHNHNIEADNTINVVTT